MLALLGQAIARLGHVAFEGLSAPLSPAQTALLAGWVVVIGYAEGYRAFQRRFAPRVVARAMHLAAHPRPVHVALAPLFCMALLHAPRRRLITSWVFVLGIVLLVVTVRRLPQPYRGIIDAGVVLALIWGAAAIVALFVGALRGRPVAAPAEVPDAGR